MSSITDKECEVPLLTMMFPKFILSSTSAQLALWAQVGLSDLPTLHVVHDNVFPSVHPVLRLSSSTGQRVVSPMRLGLIPSYAHDDHEAMHLMEAHAEAMTCCNNFRSAFKRRRCLIPATAFHAETGSTQYGCQLSSFSLQTDEIFAIAGVWESWIDDEGDAVQSFALIDAHPEAQCQPFCDRMPVIVAPADQENWLRPGSPPLEFLKPQSPPHMAGWKIAPYIARPALEARF